MSDIVRCYYCGRIIEKEEDMIMKNVSMGLFRVERKPFHTGCWRKHHEVQLKKGIIATIFLITLIGNGIGEDGGESILLARVDYGGKC